MNYIDLIDPGISLDLCTFISDPDMAKISIFGILFGA